MHIRLGGILSAIVLIANTSANAGDLWECSFSRVSGSAKGLMGSARIRISSDVLEWQVLFSKSPVPPFEGTQWTTFKHHLLENSAVGIVAVTSEARMDKDNGALIGATIITVNKVNGGLRMGSVMDNGNHELLTGHCDLKKDAKAD